jgi:hypothetical protein
MQLMPSIRSQPEAMKRNRIPERCLHCHKAAFDVAVVMGEIFDPKLDFGPIAENHTNPVGIPCPVAAASISE